FRKCGDHFFVRKCDHSGPGPFSVPIETENGLASAGCGSGPGARIMAKKSQTVRRTVQFKFTLPGADSGQLASLVKASAPFYQAFGGHRVRLLQNVDDPARFVHEMEYET